MQITHQYDPETGNMKQIVTAKELRRMLRAAGESLVRPKDFGPNDEWFTK